MATHTRTPQSILEKYGYIGEPPLSAEIAQPAVRAFRYLNQWGGSYQILHFCQDARDVRVRHGDRPGIDGYYYICIPSAPKADASPTERQLHGALIPWVTKADTSVTGAYDAKPKITWQQATKSEQTLYENAMSDDLVVTDSNKDLDWSRVILLGKEAFNDDFSLIPAAGGGFVWGRLGTQRMRTAALGVWMGPDANLYDDEAQILMNKIAPGKVIRGYNTTANRESLGNLIHLSGTGTATDDDLFMNTKKCLFGWSHGLGIYLDNTYSSYTNIGRSGTTYPVTRQRHNSTYESTTFDAEVAIVVSHVGLDSSSNQAWVKITSSVGGDYIEWELDDSDDSDGGWGGGAGLGNPVMFEDGAAECTTNHDTLPIASAGDFITIEVKNPGAGEIILHAVYIWDRSYNA